MSTTETIPTPDQAIGDPNAPVVSFEHVSIGFDGHSVLINISFQARSGEMVIILGPAGGGKSILLKLANGLIPPDAGRVRLFGKDINKLSQKELFDFRRRTPAGPHVQRPHFATIALPYRRPSGTGAALRHGRG